MYPKSKKKDVNDAVINSIYDEKRKKYEEKEEFENFITAIQKFRDLLRKIDPALENYLELWRELFKVKEEVKTVLQERY